ncbi:MAG: lytic transglycosylase domain-containing protein [Nitrospirae bacterium]|nr:lytic transglycosylase domain-containing protein [Nitrospirota bacterium]
MAKDKKKSVSLAFFLASMEEYNTALGIISSSFSRDMLYRDQGIDPRVWRLMYPTGYSEMVNRYADENDTDPLLLYALIREESWFNRSVVSSAGAVGLMQLMPQTASAVNGSHVDRDSLFDPDINLALGTRFFAGLLRQYDGNMIVALASYNAGPVVVTRWLQEREGFALDEFIEDIPYKETRNYVKKVFTSYMEYLRMAGMESKAGSGEGERLTHRQ